MTTRIKDDEQAIQLDTTDPTGILVGMAKPGTATSAALWQIRKVNVVGVAVSITFANGTTTFTNVWDSRGSYTYS